LGIDPTVIEILDVDAQDAGELPEPRRRQPVNGGLILLNLLEPDADEVSEVRLR
jgi:hypothetical protein